MGFKDCIRTLRDAGDIDEADYAELAARYDNHLFAQRMVQGADVPEAAARDALVAELVREAAQKERQIILQAEAQERLDAAFKNYRDASGKADVVQAAEAVLENRNNLLAGVPSVVGRRDALIGYAHGRLEGLLHEARRKTGSGLRGGQTVLSDMVAGAFSGNFASPESRAFMQSYWRVTDELIDRFNAAGGDVGKLKNYLPQRHDARPIAAAGLDAWKAFIRDRLDVEKMHDPLFGGPLAPARLDEALDAIYARIVTNGAIDRLPSGQPAGRGKLANQRQDERFLVFRDAAGWREYNAAFGGNDVYAALMGHVHGLADDIAKIEMLGPNPNATIEWMKSYAQQEAAKAKVGQPSLFRGEPAQRGNGELDAGQYRIERLWNVINGGTGIGNMAVADAMSGVRSFLTAVNLPGAALTALAGDPFQQRWARTFAGIPQLRFFTDLVRQALEGSSPRDIARAGVVFDDAMQQLRTDLRGHALTSASAELARWLPDRVFQWTLLTPWTRLNQRTQALSFMFEAGDRIGQSLDDMRASGLQGERFARFLEGFGIGEAQWAMIRAARPLDHGEAGGLLRPMDIVDSAPGDRAAFDLAMRYSEALHAFAEEAVPQGTNRIRAALGRDTQAGTLPGEVVRSAGMYLSYPATMLSSLLRATAHELADGNARGGGFFASAVIGLTIGGALMQTLAELRKGRDPKPADAEFWAVAFAKGGGLGFWGDYLFADMERGPAQVAARAAGPVVGFAADALSVIDPLKFAAGEEKNRAAAATRFGQKYVPFQNMWHIRPATERLVWDRLQLLADPQAYRSWARKERELRNEGQGMWWSRGEALPRRAPDFSTILP